MANHDYNIANQSAPSARADINNALAAIVSNNSGASEPTTTFANMWWYDTTNNKLKFRNEGDSAWIEVGTLDQSSLSFAGGTPTGAVIAFAMPSSPTGWLQCDGSAVSRTTYAALFAAIGTTYGTGDGSTTFNLPDLRGEFVRGWDDSRGVDSGRTMGSTQSDDVLDHRHDSMSMVGGSSIAVSSKTATYGLTSNTVSYGSGGGGPQSSANTMWSGPVDTGIASSTESRPRNVALNYCIKY